MKLNEILQRLATARLITLTGDKYELAHDTLAKLLAGKRSAEEQAVINWERLVRNKWRASVQSGTPDYLTTAQLAGLLPYQAKLDLNAEERQFLLDSQEDSRKKVLAAKRWQQMKAGMALVFFILISIALIFALSNKAAVERELERNQRILAGMYFYSDNFALCVQKDSTGHLKYGFIDKNGKVRIPQIYDEANPFDDYGFARVKIKEKLFLIDTNNVQYSLAETTLALNENTRALRLSEKDLKEIPKEVFDYKELQILYLRGNNLSSTAPKIQGLSNLKVLDLGENNLLELPKELGHLSGLKVLDIRKNKLTNIDAITPLAQLEFLNLSHNNLEAIPAEIQQWQALKLLNLSNNNLKTIPDEMVGLKQLKGLNLYNNPNLVEIPAGLDKPSLVLVLNEGQHAMLGKGGKHRYENDLVGGDSAANVTTNTVTNSTINTITTTGNDVSTTTTNTDFVKPKLDKSFDCKGAYFKNTKQGDIHILATKPEVLVSPYGIQFENTTDNGIIAIVSLTVNSAAMSIMDKGNKLVFISSNFVMETFDFIFEVQKTMDKGNTIYVNILQMDLKFVKWFAENDIAQIKFVSKDRKKMVPYKLEMTNQLKLKQLANCFLAELDITKIKEKSADVRLDNTTVINKTTADNNNVIMTEKPKAIEIEMVHVEGGSFTMGCTNEQGGDCFDEEKTSHKVTLNNYSISKYEVTQAQWKAVMGNNPSQFSNCGNCPVEMVGWNEIQIFIDQLNKKTGKKYRLPTEAEWEYAARGGNKSKRYKYSGNNNISPVTWYDENSENKTHPVGQKTANELGIYDMSGNVYEYCSDWYGVYINSSQKNPEGASTGTQRVLRGGSWHSNTRYCRTSCRSNDRSTYRRNDIGFRLAL